MPAACGRLTGLAARAGDPGRAAALIAILTDRLLTGASATMVLEAWCREQNPACDPIVLAHPVAVPPRAPSAVQRVRLAVSDDGPVRYRRVRLTCGDRVLSVAENWYVPGRLTDAMNRILDTTRTPFGRVVHPLTPSRRNLALHGLWREEGDFPEPQTPLFTIHAVLSTAEGVPFCEVAETYLGAVLAARV